MTDAILQTPTPSSTENGMSRRLFMGTAMAALAASYIKGGPAHAQAQERKFAASLGWTAFDSGRHLHDGFKAGVKEFGGTLTVTDANFDVKKQSDQIDSLISAKPDALFVTPANPDAVLGALQRATDAGIPIFCVGTVVPGIPISTTVIPNDFGMGQLNFEFIARKLGGKGRIGRVMLPTNRSWDQRTRGLEYAARFYPGIEIVQEWAFNPAGNVTPRQGVDNMLTADPDLDAIWCAWDGAAAEGTLAARAANKPDLIITGIDGGTQAFSFIQGGTQFKQTMAISWHEASFLCALYAHEFLNGNMTPPLIVPPTYAVTQDMLQDGIPDDYDTPGRAAELGWTRVL